MVGNSRITKILIHALQRDKVPNSLLFSGPAGAGKRATALVVAKAMNCRQKTDDACEECSSCVSVNRENFPDLIMIRPEKDIIKIDQIRMLIETAYLRPMVGKRRIFIIECAEKMNEEAANSLLKILEEPPLFTYIFLITENPYIIPSTIKSRCQILNFSPISREDIEKCLISNKVEEDKARIISFLALGNIERALNIDWEEIHIQRRKAWQWFQGLLGGKGLAGFLKDYSNRQRRQIEDEIVNSLEMLASFCRDLILIKEDGSRKFLLNPDFDQELDKVKNHMNMEQAMNLLTLVERSLEFFQRNLNIRVSISSMLLNFMGWENV